MVNSKLKNRMKKLIFSSSFLEHYSIGRLLLYFRDGSCLPEIVDYFELFIRQYPHINSNIIFLLLFHYQRNFKYLAYLLNISLDVINSKFK